MLPSTTIPWTAVVKGSTDFLIDGISATTTKLELSASVYSLFSYIEWSFMADSGYMESGMLSIGTMVEFTFYPSGSDPIKITYGILSVTNGPGGNATTLGQAYSLILISGWYFNQFIGSHAYKGTIYDIIMKMFKDDYNNTFESNYGQITKTYDNENLIRYRTHMSQGKFIEERLRDYMVGQDKSSSYVYTNIQNKFEIVDKVLLGTLSKYNAIDYSSPDLASFNTDIGDANKSKFMVFATGIIPKLNTSEEHQLWQLVNAGSMWLYRDYTGSVKISSDAPILNAMVNKVNNKLFAPVSSSKNIDKISKLYINDSGEYYSDINNSIINKYTKDLQKEMKLEIFCYPNISIDVGRICSLYLLNNSAKPSIFSQDYLIESVSHIFKGIKCHSHMTVSTTGLNYEKIGDIGDYLDLNSLVATK
jgi:hypothetical protein